MKIHQLLTCLSYGDAISNYALQIRNITRNWGYQSEIYSEQTHPDIRTEARPFSEFQDHLPCKDDLVLYHFSVGSVISAYMKKVQGRKVMFYHNISPYEYFVNIHPYLVSQIVRGREELKHYSSLYDLVIADSEYNKSELEECNYRNVVNIPVKPCLDTWGISPDPTLTELLNDGKKNILFVGRITPNKGHADLIKSYYFLEKSGYKKTRLIMVGEYHGFEKYYWWLQNLCKQLKLENVWFSGLVDYEDLVAYYDAADLFFCLSQHEGFCVPLVEAMYFHVPILALAKTAVPETLRGSGMTVSEIDHWKIAELLELLLEDTDLRNKVLAKQDEVLDYYLSYDLDVNLKKHLEPYLK